MTVVRARKFCTRTNMSCMFVQLSCVDCNGQFHAACLQRDVNVTGEASDISRVVIILSSKSLEFRIRTVPEDSSGGGE